MGSQPKKRVFQPQHFINRELSWLEFNQRVLEQTRDASHPLLERVKFLSIVGNNLDEFFMIRVATTFKKLKAGIGVTEETASVALPSCANAASGNNAAKAAARMKFLAFMAFVICK